MLKTFAAAVAAIGLLTTAAPAQLAPIPVPPEIAAKCGPRGEIVRHLSESFGEQHFAVLIKSERLVFEIFINHEKSTWTIIRTSGNISCFMAVGVGAFINELVAPIEGKDS